MKKIAFFLAGAFALLSLAACGDDEDNVNNSNWDEDSYWAAQATVTSSDAGFTATGDGGAISFPAEGGQVTLTVDCGCGWVADNAATDLFTATATGTTLTVTAVQNTVEEELGGTITLRTETRKVPFATITVTQTAYGAPTISAEVNEWRFPAVGTGTLSTEIAVDASDEWTVEASASWLSVSRTATGVALTASENGETAEREVTVTLSCTDGIRTVTDIVTVAQDGVAYITLSGDDVVLGPGAGLAPVTVGSNFSWDYSYDASNGWFTVSRDGDMLVVTPTANETGVEREGTVTLTAGDGAENAVEEMLAVRQGTLAENDMVFTYTITYENTTTHLPLYGTVDCTVNWGDGVEEKVTSVQPAHTYALEGEYDVTVRGTVTALYTKDIASSSAPLSELTAVRQWGGTGLTSMEYGLYHCTKLASLPESAGDGLADVTTFYYAFYNCASLADIPADLFSKCTKTTNFTLVFSGCAMTTVPAGLFDSCTAATTFQGVLHNCSSLTEIPAGLFDSCVNVTDFQAAFYGCKSLKSIPEHLFDKCTKVIDFRTSFYGCTSLTEIPEELFHECPDALSFMGTFYNCSKLGEIPAGLFEKSTKVTDFTYCFYGCTAITTIPKELFCKCPSVTTFGTAFYQCSNLEEIPAGLFDENTNVTDFSYVFSFCKALKAIPAGLFDNCTKAKTFYAAFQSCQSVTEMPAGLFDNCPDVTNFSFVANGCASPTIPKELFDHNLKVTDFEYALASWSYVTDESPYTELSDGTRVHLYERSKYTSRLGCTAPKNYDNCFSGSTFSDMETIPSDWGGNGTSTSSISESALPCAETSLVFEPEEF